MILHLPPQGRELVEAVIAEHELPLRTRMRDDGLVVECSFDEPAHDVGRVEREAVFFLMQAIGRSGRTSP